MDSATTAAIVVVVVVPVPAARCEADALSPTLSHGAGHGPKDAQLRPPIVVESYKG